MQLRKGGEQFLISITALIEIWDEIKSILPRNLWRKRHRDSSVIPNKYAAKPSFYFISFFFLFKYIHVPMWLSILPVLSSWLNRKSTALKTQNPWNSKLNIPRVHNWGGKNFQINIDSEFTNWKGTLFQWGLRRTQLLVCTQ